MLIKIICIIVSSCANSAYFCHLCSQVLTTPERLSIAPDKELLDQDAAIQERLRVLECLLTDEERGRTPYEQQQADMRAEVVSGHLQGLETSVQQLRRQVFATLNLLEPQQVETRNEVRPIYEEWLKEQIALLHKVYWHDPILSQPETEILSKGYGFFQLRQHMRNLVQNEYANASDLQNNAVLFFDVNGMRTVVDLTDHENGTAFLRELAKVFIHGTTTKLLRDQGLEVTPMSAGGDEFHIHIHSSVRPLAAETLEQFNTMYRQEVEGATQLSGYLNLRDPVILRKFAHLITEEGMPGPSNLEELEKMLPERFKPSISTGAATMLEIVRSMDPEQIRAFGSFTDAITAITQALFKLADERQQTWKEQFKDRLEKEDPKTYALLIRNDENRDLHSKLSQAKRIMRKKNNQLQAERLQNHLLRKENTQLQEENMRLLLCVAEMRGSAFNLLGKGKPVEISQPQT